MSSSGTVLGCLVLSTPETDFYASLVHQNLEKSHIKKLMEDAPKPKLPRLSFPFDTLEKVEYGNHLTGIYENTSQSAFDFYVGGSTDAEYYKSFVPSRAMQITGFRVGETTEHNLTKKCVQYLLAVNSNPSPEDTNKVYLDVAFEKVYSKISERFFLTLELTSRSSKFVLMTRDMPIYFTGFCDDESTYLMWSNESNLEDRLREHYGDRFYYYRMQPFLNGICVIQSMYLQKKIIDWKKNLRDRLKMMNALELHLFRRRITDTSPVNNQAPVPN
jgi:hypothetical protein